MSTRGINQPERLGEYRPGHGELHKFAGRIVRAQRTGASPILVGYLVDSLLAGECSGLLASDWWRWP